MLLEWGSCKRGVDKIIRTRIAFVEGAVQPYGTGVEVLLWWMKISLRIEIVNGLDL